jgi:hypothetical protein
VRKLFLFVAVAVAAASAAARGGAAAASPVPVPPVADAASETASADSPVSLADAQGFDVRPAPEVGQDEITEARRTLASAVSSEKFMDGAAAVFVAYLIYLVVF